MNIYQKLAAITAEMAIVAKNLNVETGKGKSYKAVSERDILDKSYLRDIIDKLMNDNNKKEDKENG